jgi:hypothetical protein
VERVAWPMTAAMIVLAWASFILAVWLIVGMFRDR